MANDKDFLVNGPVTIGKDTKVTVGSITSSDIDLATGNYFDDTLAANTTYTISNAGGVQAFQLEVTGGLGDGYKYSLAVYEDKSFDASSQVAAGRDVRFKADGTKMYLLSNSGDLIYQYSLSTAWDVTTASYDSKSFATTSQENSPSGFYLASNGTKLYVVGSTNAVHQYTLSTAWDISTASFDNKEKSITPQDSAPTSLALNPTGTKMFVAGNSNSKVYEYTLSTAFDVSTATYSTFLSIQSSPSGIELNSTGTKLYVVRVILDSVLSYTLPTAYSLSGGSEDGYIFLRSENNDLRGVTFGDSGKRMYTMDDATESVYQYTVAEDTTITWPNSIEWAGGVAPGAPANGETDVFTFVTDDGGTTYTGVQSIDNAS
jgi:hypothetical protein